MREIFDKYASVEKAGEKFMTYDDFIVKYLNLYPQVDDPNSKKSIKVLGGILDTSKDGVISFIEFSAFEAVLCQPDALYRTAFQVGSKSFNVFKCPLDNVFVMLKISFLFLLFILF